MLCWVRVACVFAFAATWVIHVDAHPLLRVHDAMIDRVLRATATTAADDKATCDAATKNSPFGSYLTAIPETMGLRNCAASNLNDVLTALSAPNAQCTLTTLLELFGSDTPSAGMAAVNELFAALLAGTNTGAAAANTDLMNVLSAWTKDGSTKNKDFCAVMNTKMGPCINTLVPVLVSILEKKGACCGELVGYLEVAKLVVPPGKTLTSVVVDVVNGLHRTMCTTTSSGASSFCGQRVFSYLASVVEKTGDTSLLSPLVFSAGMPLLALPDGKDACAALDAKSFASRVTEKGSAFRYAALSCCGASLASLVQSLDSIVTHITGNSIAETLNLMAGIQGQDDKVKFKSPYETLAACSFADKCANPTFLLSAPTESSAAAPTTSPNTKNKRPQGVKCETIELCNKDNVCTSVCAQGTVKIVPWAARAITYQLNQSYDQPLCFVQLPGTHNSATTLARGYGNRDQLVNQGLDPTNAESYVRTHNQFLTLTDQLNLGVRFIEIDVHYFAKALRSGHCSRINLEILDGISATIVREMQALLSPGQGESSALVEWQSSLVGCLPSLSGLRAEDQQLHKDTLNEVATWVRANPNDVIILYAEVGSEIVTFGKYDQLLDLYKETFGDLLFTPADLKTAGGDWKKFPLSDLVKKGKRVIVISDGKESKVMFQKSALCDGWSDIPRGKTGMTGTFWGQKTNTGSLVRAYKSELHYTTLSEDELGGSVVVGTASEPALVNSETLPMFVKAGVNILAPDGLDGATMTAMVWSWAENEPTNGDKFVEVSAKDGRWRGVTDQSSIKNVACVSSSSRLSWTIVAQGASCPSGSAVGAPRLAVENVALVAALKAARGEDATAQLNVDLSQFPVISAEDEAAYARDNNGSSGTPNSLAIKPTQWVSTIVATILTSWLVTLSLM